MSLKAFHIFFIALSILLLFGFAAWLVQSFFDSKDSLMLVAALLSFVAGISLIFHAIRFLRKLKHVRYL